MGKPNIGTPKGMRDFGAQEMGRRNYIFQKIKSVFERYGYTPLETPSMENLSVLMGKYGDEGDKLLFKVLNSGEFLKKTTPQEVQAGEQAVLPKIAEKGLRYDLTVPFARFVATNHGVLTLPYKRYQIQPVWRADRPQKGRYREFYQCDADVVGTESLICEAEIIGMMNDVFRLLGIADYTIKLNNRKLLEGLAGYIGQPDKVADFCVAIDKLDKIGAEKVGEELQQKGFSADSMARVQQLFDLKGNNVEKLQALAQLLPKEGAGQVGIDELSEVLKTARIMGINLDRLQIDLSLARGLAYYTGAIFEVKVNNVAMGSISGGGRYDDLTGVFGLPNMPGVGFSFGVDRIYDVMEELNLFPDTVAQQTQLLFTYFDEQGREACLRALQPCRQAGIAAEIYPDLAKVKKQLNYANKKGIPFVAVVGEDELANGEFSLKNMESGKQEMLPLQKVIEIVGK